MFTLTLLLQGGFGLSAWHAGLAFAPMGISFSTMALLSSRIVGRYGLRVVAFGGALICLGLLLLAVLLRTWGAGTGLPWVMVLIAAVGIGNGIVTPQLFGVALVGVRPHQAGVGSGILTTAQQFAGSAGIAVVGTVFFVVAGAFPVDGDYARAMTWSAAIDIALFTLVMALVGYNNRARAAAGPVTQPGAD
jgi:MFS family permease